MPHAIFTNPEIAGVGLTEDALIKKGRKYLVGRHRYIHTGKGLALHEEQGFVKILSDRRGHILGCHIIGQDASVLLHEVLVAMRHGLGVREILHTVHIHPALNEVVQRACADVVHQL